MRIYPPAFSTIRARAGTSVGTAELPTGDTQDLGDRPRPDIPAKGALGPLLRLPGPLNEYVLDRCLKSITEIDTRSISERELDAVFCG